MPTPPVSALSQLKKLDQNLVIQIRNRFLAEANQNPKLYESEDLEQIQNNDWQVQRFLLECKQDIEHSYESLRNAMKWRREEGIYQCSPADFPAEYYQSGYIFRHGRDKNGAIVLYFRANIHRKTNEWNSRLKKFFIYQVEQIDRNCDGKGVTLVIDCSNIGVSNVDMDMLKFIVTSFSKYYPKLFDAIIIHQLPFLLQYIFKLVQTWLPEDDRKFFHMTNNKTITDYIDKNQLPSFLLDIKIANEQWRSLPATTDVEGPILPADQFVQRYGSKFEINNPKDSEKLSYLKAYLI
ncbi:motile sperm domain-containing protein 2-like [Dermatophagoides pteronyssinus]|uniref:Motile sperm domain-containing protein 2-like n=1 Tax=Dermatophagoides pteronyssinus TaxID=6956 RepID=A0A6P6XW80_DERPT|nr:motile sperm domain-containing protein 2-like [Dermatophagoides pteronyssinus]